MRSSPPAGQCNKKYVVKFNEPETLKAEAAFMNCYKNVNLIPNLLYVEPSYRYIVYSFISGTTKLTGADKDVMLQTLVEKVLNRYQHVCEDSGFGLVEEQVESWPGFLWEEILEVNKVVNPYLADAEYDFVLNIFKSFLNCNIKCNT